MPGVAPTLEQWTIVKSWRAGCDDILLGRVFGHPRIADGHWATTSLVVEIDVAARRARTLNTEYRLGARLSESVPTHVLQYLAATGYALVN
ncbi:MAG: hypothetical protein JWL84_6443 [Rhodospirillales bacterium]|nr:hypothetical protein [Rhodospirillales bacterium]